MTISWCILTFNRSSKVIKSYLHNLKYAGYGINEIIWCDNGSERSEITQMNKFIEFDVAIEFSENKGVAKGYNAAMAMARSDYIVITGCDMLMPENWLKTFKEYHEKIPNTGVSSIYCHPLDKVPERIRGEKQIINGLPIVPAMPIERRMFRRDLLKDIGYFNEGFGLYAWDDIAWSNTAEKVCKEKGLLTYVIPDQIALHLGTEGVSSYREGGDDKAYHEMKQKEVQAPYKQELLQKLASDGWPKFNPYCHCDK